MVYTNEDKTIKVSNNNTQTGDNSMKRPDYSYGYEDRPINQKRGVYNRYLDALYLTGSNDDPIPAGVGGQVSGWIPPTILYSKLKRDITNNGGVILPTDGTYIITGDLDQQSGGVDNWTTTGFRLYIKDGSGLTIASTLSPRVEGNRISLNYIQDWRKGEEIQLWVENLSSSGVFIYVQLSIVKIS